MNKTFCKNCMENKASLNSERRKASHYKTKSIALTQQINEIKASLYTERTLFISIVAAAFCGVLIWLKYGG